MYEKDKLRYIIELFNWNLSKKRLMLHNISHYGQKLLIPNIRYLYDESTKLYIRIIYASLPEAQIHSIAV